MRWRRPRLLGAPPTPRYGHTAVRHGPDVVVYGGREPGGLCDPQSLLVLDAADRDAMRWRVVACAGRAPKARYEHAAVVVGESLVVYGGRGDGVGGGDAEQASARARSPRARAARAPLARPSVRPSDLSRSRRGAQALGGVHVLRGLGRASPTWASLGAFGPAPPLRYGHAAVALADGRFGPEPVVAPTAACRVCIFGGFCVVRTGQRDPVARRDERFLAELVVLDLNAEDEWPRDASERAPESRPKSAHFPGASPPASPPKPHNPAILPGM